MLRIGIFGYGNLGRGAAAAAMAAADMELCGIFTRRDPAALGGVPDGVPVYAADSAAAYRGAFDVLLLCGGSADDLPRQTPLLARAFSVVDSFDTHAKIPAHFAAVDAAACAGGHVALISAGWDPGLFSLMRLYAEAALPRGKTYTFWGAGVSEGHSDAASRTRGRTRCPSSMRSPPCAKGRHRRSRRARCIGACAMSYPRRTPTPPQSRARSARCPPISPILTPRCILLHRKKWRATTPPCRTAAACSETGMQGGCAAWNFRCASVPIPPSPAACWSPARAPSAAPPRAARSAAARSSTSRPPTSCPTPPAPMKRCSEV